MFYNHHGQSKILGLQALIALWNLKVFSEIVYLETNDFQFYCLLYLFDNICF